MRILVISSFQNALGQDNGGSLRIYNLIEQLRLLGNKIIILQPAVYPIIRQMPGYKIHYFQELRFKKFNLIYFADINPSLINRIRQILNTQDIDLIQISFPWGAVATHFIAWHIPIVYDCHNIESEVASYMLESRLKLLSRYRFLRNFKKTMLLNYVRLQEGLTCKYSDHIISVSDHDIEILRKRYKVTIKKITKIPIGINIDKFNNNASKEQLRKRFNFSNNHKLILFHGTFEYDPNQEALRAITEFIGPRVAGVDKNIRFVLAGKGLLPFRKDNIISLGCVEEISHLIKACDLAIVPLRNGSGARIKILEYFAAKIPVITTKKGIEGIPAKDGEHAFILDKVDDSFIDKILEVSNSDYPIIKENALQLVKENYNWEKVGLKLNNLYSDLVRFRHLSK